MSKYPLFLLSSLIAVAALGGSIYKWVDANGVTHYAEAPSEAQKSQRLDIEAAPAAGTPNAAPTQSWQQQEEAFRQRHQARQALQEKELQQRQQAREQAAIQEGALTPVPGRSGASPALQRDVLKFLLMIDSAADASCARHRVADTEWIETDAATRKAIERWTLDRCGKQVRYRITFTPAPQGGMNFAIQAEP